MNVNSERIDAIERLVAGIRADRHKPNSVERHVVAIEEQLKHVRRETADLCDRAEKWDRLVATEPK